ncbi:hypothetical protein [Crossiella sp. CA198]|uniref:hypothetical protein n=1 Tax=Crossiella sp. CA198 TaxID=3455607 RepID=UPI003F8D21F9
MNDKDLRDLREHYDNTDTSTELAKARAEFAVDPDPMVVTSLRLPKPLMDWVRERAASEHTRPTTFIRQILERLRDGEDDRGDHESRLRALEATVATLSGARERVRSRRSVAASRRDGTTEVTVREKRVKKSNATTD